MGLGGLGNDGVPEPGAPGVGSDGEGVDDCEPPLGGCGVPLPDGCDVEEDGVGIPAVGCDGTWISGNVDGTLDKHPLSPEIVKTNTTTFAAITIPKIRLR